MTDKKINEILLQGANAWNEFRKNYPGALSFNRPSWYDSPDAHGVQIKGHNRIDFSGMNFNGVAVYNAFAEGLNFRDANIIDCHFEEGDFSRADFRGTLFQNTKFNKTIFTGTSFAGASFINCNLNRINLVGANFCVKEIRDTVVYGISAWDLETWEEAKQSNLVIERTYDLYSEMIAQGTLPLTVDDIELAQFVYYLSNHKKMRDTLNILNDKGVLLLGKFKEGGLAKLYKLRDILRTKGYMPMIFDFDRPNSLSITETVVTMAGLSKFIVADLSGSSVPHELATILTQIKKPILALGDPYSMFPDLADQTKILIIKNEDNLEADLTDQLPVIDGMHADRIRSLAERYA